jgi:hypothetical protein
MNVRTTSEILDSARPIVAAWRSSPTASIRATEPHSVVRFLRLREESGLTSEAWCRHLRVPIATGYFWSQGKTAGGQDWPALAAALAKANGQDLAAGMNAALAPFPAKALLALDHAPEIFRAGSLSLTPGDKAAALAMLANATVPAKPPVFAPPVEVDIEANVEIAPSSSFFTAADLAEFNALGDSLRATREQAHADARDIITAKRARGCKTTPWSLGEAATLVRLHKAAGGTMDAFSKAVGLQNSALAVWSSGRTTTGKPWPDLCEALGIPVPAAKPSPSPVLDKGTPIEFTPPEGIAAQWTAPSVAADDVIGAVSQVPGVVWAKMIGNAPADRLAALGIRATSMGDDDTITLALSAGGPAQRALVRFALGITPSLRIEV